MVHYETAVDTASAARGSAGSAADATVQKLASALEDISVSDGSTNDSQESAYVLPAGSEAATGAGSDADLSGQDALIVKLLELVDRYEALANGEYRLNYINGSLNLSRSNYNNGSSLGKKFGPASYDLRSYECCKEVRAAGGRLELVDKLGEQRRRQKEERERARAAKAAAEAAAEKAAEAASEKPTGQEKDGPVDGGATGKEKEEEDEKVATGRATGSAGAVDGPAVATTTLKKRKDGAKGAKGASSATKSGAASVPSVTEINEEADAEPAAAATPPTAKLLDPILQFGGLVPYQLRQSQSYFEKWLANSIALINLRTEIAAVVREIDAHTPTESSVSDATALAG